MSQFVGSPLAGRPRPAVARLAVLALLFALPLSCWGATGFGALVGEDGIYEWLQAGCLGATGVVALRAVKRSGPGRRRLVLAAVGLGTLFVAGEELAWGTRLLDLNVEQVQAVNRQDDVTLHNLGLGLEASFLAMACISTALAVWQVARRRPELACWFAVPAVYGAVRLLAGAETYEVAKLSEVAELAFAVGALRLVLAVTRRPA